MKHAYSLGLLFLACAATAVAKEPTDASRYEIWFDGNWTFDNGRPEREMFTWIVDEDAPAKQQIIHLGKSICDDTISCNVEITTYQIRIQIVHEGTKSGDHFTAAGRWTIDRVNGVGQFTGTMTEAHGKELKKHSIKGTFLCDRHVFKPAI